MNSESKHVLSNFLLEQKYFFYNLDKTTKNKH